MSPGRKLGYGRSGISDGDDARMEKSCSVGLVEGFSFISIDNFYNCLDRKDLAFYTRCKSSNFTENGENTIDQINHARRANGVHTEEYYIIEPFFRINQF